MTSELKQLIRVKKVLLKRATFCEKELRTFLVDEKPTNTKLTKKLEAEAQHLQKLLERCVTITSMIDKIVVEQNGEEVVKEPKSKRIKTEETPIVIVD
jgi:hypothetical protein